MAAGRGQRIAVVGAGWAGLAAAVEATQAGHRVVLSDMAPHPGGRARGVHWDNGQHILIGAYRETLALMRRVDAPVDALLWRQPLRLQHADGSGLALPPGRPLPAFVRGVLAAPRWGRRDKLALLREALVWLGRGFTCSQDCTVAQLCLRLSVALQRDLIEPLCIAALNTPPARASGRVFLRVLHDALFAGRGGSDLLLPRAGLSALLPAPAVRWLEARGVECRWRRRAQVLRRVAGGWELDAEPFDAVILACTASEAARLVDGVAPAWRHRAAALRYEPIVTVTLHDAMLRTAQPMTVLRSGPDAPAQFAFNLGMLGRAEGCHAFVASSAGAWLDGGVAAAAQAVLRQARQTFPRAFLAPDTLRHATAERRATFACTPALERPPMRVAPALLVAGDYVDGPYPATLEGAVRSGIAAARALDMS